MQMNFWTKSNIRYTRSVLNKQMKSWIASNIGIYLIHVFMYLFSIAFKFKFTNWRRNFSLQEKMAYYRWSSLTKTIHYFLLSRMSHLSPCWFFIGKLKLFMVHNWTVWKCKILTARLHQLSFWPFNEFLKPFLRTALSWKINSL